MVSTTERRSRGRPSEKRKAARTLSAHKFERILRIFRNGTWKEREQTAELVGRRRYGWAIPFLIDGLKWRGDKARNAAIKALVQIGTPSISPLTSTFNNAARGPRIRSGAATCIGLLRVHGAIPELVRGLSERDVSVRLSSMVALYRFKYRRAAPKIMELLDDESGGIRVNAADILGSWRERKAADCLIEALGDEKWYVRQHAAAALGNVRAIEARSALRRLLTDPRKAVRIAAIKSLKLIGAS